MKLRYDTYCGLYCGACHVLIANRKGIVEETARKWEMDPEDIHCHGCKTDVTSVYCRTCDIKECAENRSTEFCFQCEEYPCPRLVEFRNDECPHHSVVLKNLDIIGKEGVSTWLDQQESRWSCPECQTQFGWYDEVCTECGKKVYSCKDEEKDLDSAREFSSLG